MTSWALVLALAVGVAAQAPQADVVRDLDYIPRWDYPNGGDRLDVYAPPGASASARKAPVVVMFHGGGLTGGDRRSERRFGERMAAAGYVVVVPNYRLSPGVRHPAHVEDAAFAVAWAKRYAPGFGGDAQRIFLAGYSAGGYLAAALGSDPRYLRAHDLSPGDLAGLILIAATYDLQRRPAEMLTPWSAEPAALGDASPVRHFGSHVPRTLMLVGSQDAAWRQSDHQAAAKRLKAAGQQDVTLRVIAGADHESVRGDASGEHPEVAAAIRTFIDRARRD